MNTDELYFKGAEWLLKAVEQKAKHLTVYLAYSRLYRFQTALSFN